MTTTKLPPVHPGEILSEEFLIPLNISQYRLATAIKVPPRRINEIVLQKRGITADTALRLAAFFGNSPEFWINLQRRYDLEIAREKIKDEIKIIKPCHPAAGPMTPAVSDPSMAKPKT